MTLLNIPEVNNKVAYMTFYRGLRYGKLNNALVLKTSLSKDQLTVRVKQYVELEELKTKETKGKDLRDVFTRKRTRSKSPRKQPIAPSEHLTPLRVSVEKVFSQIDYNNFLSKPVRMRSAPGRRDKNRYYEYHRKHGHNTNECQILKSKIEKLIKSGYLKEFVDKGGGSAGCTMSKSPKAPVG
ncbi:hypothetical protein LIER_05244 [Lithospermum erythrorhizon]|uniref:Reverse transcriptase domain-containing protein n=1 Tax=Lithospermum erythrorhizon TaxID=34254 RepID=A0AAV3P4N1_LITER